MGAYVSLYLLNELRKRDKARGSSRCVLLHFIFTKKYIQYYMSTNVRCY